MTEADRQLHVRQELQCPSLSSRSEQARASRDAEEAAAQLLLQEEQAAAESAQRAKQREAAKKDKKARQKLRKQVGCLATCL